jgi:hypothetical protein
VLAALALAFYPVILGIGGVVFGALGHSRGDRPLGLMAVAAAVVGMFGGLLLNALILNST